MRKRDPHPGELFGDPINIGDELPLDLIQLMALILEIVDMIIVNKEIIFGPLHFYTTHIIHLSLVLKVKQSTRVKSKWHKKLLDLNVL